MSVTVGGIVFGGATGTPYPPLSAAQVQSWAASAEAYRFRGSPPGGEGTLDAWADLNEADALARLRAAGSLVGSVVSVVYPHGTITGVAVADVAGDWQARRGTVNGGVLLVRFTFNRGADRKDGDTERTSVKVQTAPALAGPWTDEDGWAAFAGSDGLGTYVGESQATVNGKAPDPAKLGLWVRMVRKGASPVTPSDIEWAGVIVGVSSSARRDRASGVGWGSATVYRFAGVGHVLAQLFPQAWQEDRATSPNSPTPYQGSTPFDGSSADIGEPPPFNAGGVGNRGSTLVTLDVGGPQVYLHARGLGTSGFEWTALQAARACIAQVRRTVPSLPLIKLDDLTPAVLTYRATWEVARLSLLGQLASIMSTEQERTFRVTIDWTGTPSIVVVPVDLSAAGTAHDLTGPEVTDWRCDLDAATVADQWWLDAGPRSFLTTVEFVGVGTATAGGVRGWSAAQQTAYDAAADANAKEAVGLANVWHRFVVDPAWAGTDYLGASAIPYLRALDGGQETGELVAGLAYPQGTVAWKVERTLPIGSGQDWTATYPTTKIDPKAPREGPLVFWSKTGSPLSAIHYAQQIAVLDDLAGIEVGRDSTDADATKAKLVTDGFRIVATLSFVHPLSWRVSKRVTSPRTDAPRQAFTYLPPDAFSRVDAMEHAIIKVDGAGAAVHAAAGRIDGAASLTAVRDRFARWYTTPDGSAEWRRRTATTRTPDPGSIVASIKVILDQGPPVVDATVVIGSPVTRRVVSWDYYNPGVTWSVDRVVPALSGGGAGMVAAGAGAVVLGRGETAWKEGKRNA
jgi:hypothetical protein